MNKPLLLALCALAVHVAPVPAQRFIPVAAAQPGLRTISVDGEAEIRVPPDEVVLTLGVETFDRELGRAKAANDARIATILAAARDRGVPAERVRTEFMQLEPRYHPDSVRAFTVGYTVRRTVVVTLREVSAFDDLLGATLMAGATHVHGIDFRTTELRAHRDRARALAIDAAREKAEAMAGRLGQRIGAPLSMHEEDNRWWSGYGGGSWGARGSFMTQNVVQNAGGGGGGSQGTTSPGQIAVSARVTVNFALQP